MKTYIATFNRYNPQLDKIYVSMREIEAKTLSSAKKKAREIENNCHYGTLTLANLELKA